MPSEPFVLQPEELAALAETASEIPICQRCLGRAFGKRGRGFANDDRGVLAIQMADGEGMSIHTVPDEECQVCSGIFLELDEMAEAVRRSADGYEFSTYLVGTRMDKDMAEAEAGFLKALGEEHAKDAEPMKTELNREVGKRFGDLMAEAGGPADVDFNNPDITFIIDANFLDVEVQAASVYIYGRYRKLLRGIPQTRWPCGRCRGRGCNRCGGTGRMYHSSVEEVIGGPAMEMMDGEEHALHGMGREDIDARMLGRGRPFVIEVKRPRKRTLDLEALALAVTDTVVDGERAVEVLDLRYCEKAEVAELKDSRARKSYLVGVTLSREVTFSEVEDALSKMTVTVEQRTPNRVSHRRADKVRKRKVFDIGLEKAVSDASYEIRVTGEAGIYIKELMHGDQGRTQPSLAGLLGVEITVDFLDVMDIQDGAD